MDAVSIPPLPARAGRFAPLLLLLAAAACSTDRWARTRAVVKDRDLEVYLEHRIEQGRVTDPGFAHPARVDRFDLYRALGALTYREPGLFTRKEQEHPLFSEAELLRLAPALVEALGRAERTERAHFIAYNRGGGLLFSARRKSEGVLFVRPPGRLNVAFSEINEELSATEGFEDGAYRSYRDPVKILSSTTRLVERPRAYTLRHGREAGSVHPLWAVFDLETWGRSEAAPASPAAGDGPAGTTRESAEKEEAGREQEGKTPEELRKKLALLKELYEEGLLSKEAYEKAQEKLLERLK